MVVVRLQEPYVMLCVDHIVARIDVVALNHPLEDLGLVHGSLLHEVDDLVLHGDGVINVVVKLHLSFILKLTGFIEELFIVWRNGEVFTVFSYQVELADVSPGVEPVAHWVHGPDSNVLTSSQKVHSVNFLVD